MSACVSTFINGLVGFSLFRKHGGEEPKWLDVGKEAVLSLRRWAKHSDWNFSNKLYLLEAERCGLEDDEERALAYYPALIQAARDHRLVHEEGLVEERLATVSFLPSRWRVSARAS